MLSALTATQVAFLQVAVLQCVAALVWALGAWFVREERAAMAHWSAYAGLSAATWFMLALYLQSPPLLAVMVGMCAAVALRAGIRRFVRREPGWTLPMALLALVLLGGLLGDDADFRPLQAALNFGVLAVLYLGMAFDLGRYARDQLQWRRPWLLALPLLAGTFGFGSRALRALFMPESVWAEMNVHSTLNIGSALSYIVLVLLMHATLMTLVVARLVNHLQRLARRDVLTGLLNRRALHDQLDRHAQSRRRAADTFSVLMIDVDDFKAVNDRHGHAVGDRALKHIATLMTQTLRAEDRIARYGGEEFVVLLPASDLARAAAEAERVRRCIHAEPLADAASGLSLSVSVSVGVAEWAGPAEDPARLLVRADRALYRAKALGRNRVELASDAPPAPLPRPAQARP